MTKATERMSEAELAEQYDTHRDADEWGEPEPVEKATRRDVTISVRFSEAEIAAVRAAADRLGIKPTAYIRGVTLGAPSTPGNPSEQSLIEEVSERLSTLAREANDARTVLDRLLGRRPRSKSTETRKRRAK